MVRLINIILNFTLFVFPALLFAQNQVAKPNIIFILADHLGWGDLSCYGQTRIKTPNLDKLAEEGTLFTQFYSAGSVCSPSRAAFLTGDFPASHGIHGHFATLEHNEERGMPNSLDPDDDNIARTLQQYGYTTGHFGKWHLGKYGDCALPVAYGIDASKTYSSNDPEGMETWNLWRPPFRAISTQLILGETLKFVKENRNKPFFVNVWLVDPPGPLNPSRDQLDKVAHLGPKSVTHYGAPQIYFATVLEMDRQIGMFLDSLEQKRLKENTIVVFSSDNGPEDINIRNSSHSGVGDAGPFRGRKRSIYEGGIRVPLIIRWPGGDVPAGKIDNTSVIGAVDFFPFICDLTGVDIDLSHLDGESRADCFLGNSNARTKSLMWECRHEIPGHVLHKSPQLAIRDGQYKLLLNPDKSWVELYDILTDPREMNNITEKFPKMMETLSKKLLVWKASLPESPVDESAGRDIYDWPCD